MSFSKFFAWVFFLASIVCSGCGPISCGPEACPGIDAGADGAPTPTVGADPAFDPGSGFGGPENSGRTLPAGSPDGGSAGDAQ